MIGCDLCQCDEWSLWLKRRRRRREGVAFSSSVGP